LRKARDRDKSTSKDFLWLSSREWTRAWGDIPKRVVKVSKNSKIS
jgi:hypothetical protein